MGYLDLHLKESQNTGERKCADLVRAFAVKYISIVELDLNTGLAFVMKSALDEELEGVQLPWEKLVMRYAQRRVWKEDRQTILTMTLASLEKFLDEGTGFPLEVRCRGEADSYDWVRIMPAVVSIEERKLLITTENVNEGRIFKKIVELFVYENFDYFILINMKNNSYVRFSQDKEGVVLPPQSGSDYTSDMEAFNRDYVAPEDMAWVTLNMQIPNIRSMLEKEGTYAFTSGWIHKSGTYRRTNIQFQYYDREADLVLLSRTDVTHIYEEEMEKNKQLAAAQRDATHDPLTGLYNQKATVELITRSLSSQYRNQAALLFVDIDNFKLVNDTLGHQMGDGLLCYMAQAILRIVGQEGIAGRIGGDEFLLLLPGILRQEEVEACAAKVCRIFEEYGSILPDGPLVACSVGISVYPQDGTDYDTLVKKADMALYCSKRHGKNRYDYYRE